MVGIISRKERVLIVALLMLISIPIATAIPVTTTVYSPCEVPVIVTCPSYCDGFHYYHNGNCIVVGGLPYCDYDENYPDTTNCAGSEIETSLMDIGGGAGGFITLVSSPMVAFLILFAFSLIIGTVLYSLFYKISAEKQ